MNRNFQNIVSSVRDALRPVPVFLITAITLAGFAKVATKPDKVSSEATASSEGVRAPNMLFRAQDWYAYLRDHPDVSEEFYAIKPNDNGAMSVPIEAINRLQQLTGGLPKQQSLGYFDDADVYWSFDFRKDTFVRTEYTK